jgi:hypothetical protein
MRLVAPPMNAMSHIQKIAPGPPTTIAVPTPAMLPTPTRDAAESVNAWNAEMDCGRPSSSSGERSVIVRNISGSHLNCTNPERRVRYNPTNTITGARA